MKLSAKFTTKSMLAALALGAGAFACTVTSGTVDQNGGPQVTPENDSGTKPADSGPAATCETNTKQSADLVSADCQACLNAKCCTELTSCFTAAVTPNTNGGGTQDCNQYVACISDCITKSTPADQQACYDDCSLLAGEGIPAKYDGIISCAQNNGCESICNIQAPPPDQDGGTDAADQ